MSEDVRYVEELPAKADLVVIGAGIVGAATAFYAARAGLRPLVLEKRARPCSLTTPASTGAFRLQFDNLEELELVRESVELFLNFRSITGLNGYDLRIRQQGYLWATATEAGEARQRRLVALQHRWGQTDIELLSGEEARRRFPYLSPEVRQARFRQADGFLDPRALTMGLLAASKAPVAVETAVTDFDVEGGRLAGLRTTQGDIASRTAVVAAGPFSGQVAALAGLELPLQTVRRQKLVLPEVQLVPPRAPMTIDEDTGAHWRPALRGAYLLFTDPTTPPSAPADDVPLDHHFYAQLLDPTSPVSVGRFAPFWNQVWERNTAPWFLQAGQYTMTPDHRPLIGPTSIEGLYLNTGYSGHGIMTSPAGSRILADVLAGRLAPEANPFRPDRALQARELDIL